MNDVNPVKPLRLWPGVAAAIILAIVGLIVPSVFPGAKPFGMPIGIAAILTGAGAAVLILVWWLFFSRARWVDRLAAVVVMVAAVFVVKPFLHESIAGAGQGILFFLFAAQTLMLGLVIWAVASRSMTGARRWISMGVTLVLAAGVWTMVRSGGITGDGLSDFHWRWTLSPEERLLAQGRDDIPAAPATSVASDSPAPSAAAPAAPPPAAPASVAEIPATAAAKNERAADPIVRKRDPAWPSFRGPNRDSVVHGTAIDTDWSTSAPVQLWRRPIGPGWSSFAVDDDVIYTQEQRGEDEAVSAYSLKTGATVWRHTDRIRFYESNGGPGPRGTPTLANGRVYAMGATGILKVLNQRDGQRIWSQDVTRDAEIELPMWGIASSPLVFDDLVVVAVSGRLVAYDAMSGERRWLGPTGGGGYSSPHLVTIEGVPQIMLLRGSRTISVSPKDGHLLWEHRWQPGGTIVQPNVTPDGDILISVSDMSGLGMMRLHVTKGDAGWNVQEKWTSTGLKPYFNDYVVHEGHAYGFDGSILSAIDINDGVRKWKGGRYGHGQMILLADQDLLLITSEEGDLVLVSATPDKFTELATIKVLDAKTWNHPVLVGDIVLVRNGEEMAAYRLPVKK